MGISAKGVSEFQVFVQSNYIAFLCYLGNFPCSTVPNACLLLDVFTYYTCLLKLTPTRFVSYPHTVKYIAK